MACAKAIARAAEAAAIASKRAADAMADAVAASSGDSQPQPPLLPEKRGQKSWANEAAPTKRTRLPVQGGDDSAIDDGPSSGEEEGEEEGEEKEQGIQHSASSVLTVAASATAGTGAAVPAAAALLAAKTKTAAPAPAKAGTTSAIAGRLEGPRGTALTFAGRYPPKEPIKRGRFLAERQSWHDWRNGLDVYSAEDSQMNFYSYLREKVHLGAEDYDAVIEKIIQQWQMNSQSYSLAAT